MRVMLGIVLSRVLPLPAQPFSRDDEATVVGKLNRVTRKQTGRAYPGTVANAYIVSRPR